MRTLLLVALVLSFGTARVLADEVTLTEVTGSAADITIVRPDGWRQVPSSGAKVPRNTAITTSSGASLRVAMPDGTAVRVGHSSEVHFDRIEPGNAVVTLEQGRARATVPKSRVAPKQHRFQIKTRAATMGVRGTDFTVEVDPSGRVGVHVLDGTVEIAKTPEALAKAPEQTLHQAQAIDLQGDPSKPDVPYSFDPSKYLEDWDAASTPPMPWWQRLWFWIKSFFSKPGI
jgi:hypothetical protein